MPIVETEGLVLKTYNLAEADRIVLFLTREHGLIRGVAKGAKRMKSKFGSSLEPYSIVRLSYFQKDAVELVSIQQAELLRSYFALSAQPEFLDRFARLADLLTGLTAPSDPNEDLYRMVRACLETASQLPGSLRLTGLYFEIWLLRLSGYLPNWAACEICKRTFSKIEASTLQPNFQLHCSDCSRSRSGPNVTPGMRDLVIGAQRFAPQQFAEQNDQDHQEIRLVSEILVRIFTVAMGRDAAVGRVA